MKKEELQIFMKALIPSVKKIVRSEVRKIVKPIIAEAVQNQVNKILAEQFIQSMKQPKRSLMEVDTISEEVVERQRESRKREIEESRRREILKKLGADSDPGLGMIYEGLDEDRDLDSSMGQGMGSYADPLEGDDEGVDLSRFGWG